MNLLEPFLLIVMGLWFLNQHIEDYMICFVNWETKTTLFGLPGKENWEWSISWTDWMLNVWRQIFMEAENPGIHFRVYSYKNWTFHPLEISLGQKEDREPNTKDPFFIWFYVDEEIAVARGRSGGTAFWLRCRRVAAWLLIWFSSQYLHKIFLVQLINYYSVYICS